MSTINLGSKKAISFIDSKGVTRQAILKKITMRNRQEISEREKEIAEKLKQKLINEDESNIEHFKLWFENFSEIEDELLDADYVDIAKIINGVNDIRSGKMDDLDKKKESMSSTSSSEPVNTESVKAT